MDNTYARKFGFTLIEVSIVLVIIGLLASTILVGQDLIQAASSRATIAQIEKYNTATTAFAVKYGCLPGDCSNAVSFGFIARGQYSGEGDGNGLIDGISDNSGQGYNNGTYQGAGETAVFWRDLSTAGMLDGSFSTATEINPPTATTQVSSYLPAARIGNRNYVYVWNDGSTNYFGISAVSGLGWGSTGSMNSDVTLSVSQAYNIDKKMDDGVPQSGSIMARLVDFATTWENYSWAAANHVAGVSPGGTASASTSSCYDNGGVAGAIMHYSLSINKGAGINCGLSFKMQGSGR